MTLFKSPLRKRIEAEIAKYEHEINWLELEKFRVNQSYLETLLIVEIGKLKERSELLKSLINT